MGLAEYITKRWKDHLWEKDRERGIQAYYRMSPHFSIQMPRLHDDIKSTLESYLPNLNREELKQIVDVVMPDSSMESVSFYIRFNCLLSSQNSPFTQIPFYQKLQQEKDGIDILLQQKRWNRHDFFILLGKHCVDQAEKEGLIKDVLARLDKTYAH